MSLKSTILAATAVGAFTAAALVGSGSANAEPYRGDRFDDRPGIHRPVHRVTGHGRVAGADYYMPRYVMEWRARRMAVADWRGKVVDRYGYRYAQWWAARGKEVRCDGGNYAVRCEVSAIPSAERPYWTTSSR